MKELDEDLEDDELEMQLVRLEEFLYDIIYGERV